MPGHRNTQRSRAIALRHHGTVVQKLCGLAPWEIVHHIDGNPANDDPANLLITTPEDHVAWHNRGCTRKDWHKELSSAIDSYNALPWRR